MHVHLFSLIALFSLLGMVTSLSMDSFAEQTLTVKPHDLLQVHDDNYLLIFEACTGSEPVNVEEIQVISDIDSVLLMQYAERETQIPLEECRQFEVQIKSVDPNTISIRSAMLDLDVPVDYESFLTDDYVHLQNVDVAMGIPTEITISYADLSHVSEGLTESDALQCEKYFSDYTDLKEHHFSAKYLYHSFMADCVLLFDDDIWQETAGDDDDDRGKILFERLDKLVLQKNADSSKLPVPSFEVKSITETQIPGVYLYVAEGCSAVDYRLGDLYLASDIDIVSVASEEALDTIVEAGSCGVMEIHIRADNPEHIMFMIPSHLSEKMTLEAGLLAEQINSKPETSVQSTPSENQHHIPYNKVCAPGFTPLKDGCVLNDRCGAGAYAGRVCIMDGETQPYLKPHHQKYAGISIDNIICAEGKQIIFKESDSSPACVNPHSAEILKQRGGWNAEKPLIACTMQHDPVCGVDGMTYGNMCSLTTQHMAMDHKGECIES